MHGDAERSPVFTPILLANSFYNVLQPMHYLLLSVFRIKINADIYEWKTRRFQIQGAPGSDKFITISYPTIIF